MMLALFINLIFWCGLIFWLVKHESELIQCVLQPIKLALCGYKRPSALSSFCPRQHINPRVKVTHCLCRRQRTFLRWLCMAKSQQNGRVDPESSLDCAVMPLLLNRALEVHEPQLSGQLNSLCLSRCWPNLPRLAAYVAHLHVLTPCMGTMSASTSGAPASAQLTSHDSFCF